MIDTKCSEQARPITVNELNVKFLHEPTIALAMARGLGEVFIDPPVLKPATLDETLGFQKKGGGAMRYEAPKKAAFLQTLSVIGATAIPVLLAQIPGNRNLDLAVSRECRAKSGIWDLPRA